jgi:hypothetical protein
MGESGPELFAQPGAGAASPPSGRTVDLAHPTAFLNSREKNAHCLSTPQLVRNAPVCPTCGLALAQFFAYCQYLSGWHYPPTRDLEGKGRREATKERGLPPSASLAVLEGL